MINILLAVLSMLAQGTSDFVYKRAQDRGIVLETYFMVETVPFAAAAMLMGALLGDLFLNWTTVIMGLIAGVVSFWAIFCFVTSLKTGEVGVNTLIFRMNFVFVAVFATLWLEERWSVSMGAGLVFAILAIGSVTLMERAGGVRIAGGRRPIALALIGMVLFAVLNILLKIGVRDGANVGWLIAFASFSWASCAAVLAAARKRFSMPRNNWIFLPITGFLKAIAFCALLYAFRRGGLASVVVPIAQLSFLVTIGWAAVILREPLTRPKLVGLGFSVAAIVAFSVSS